MNQMYGNKRGTLTEEGSQGSQGSQYLKGNVQNSKGNNMITQPVTHVNPYKVEVISIRADYSEGNTLARADVRVSLDIPGHIREFYDLYGILVVRGKNKPLVVTTPSVTKASGYPGSYLAPQQGGFQETAIAEAVIAAWKGGRS